MKLNRTGSNWNRLERNKINENWDIIEGSYNDVVGQITDEVVGHLIDTARLDWKEPVDTVEDLPANAEVGETRMVREADPDGISYVYRYDGEKWEKIQAIDVTLVNEVDRRFSERLEDIKTNISSFYINVVSEGFLGDGTEEDTILLNQIIERAHNEGGGTIYLPPRNEPYLIRVQTGIRWKSGVDFLFGQGAVVKATPTGNSAYSIIHCEDIQNFKIINPVIIGERYEHIGSVGQWGHGINLLGAANFEIINAKISECWGDGIYIGSSSKNAYCKYGKIVHPYCSDNRRQGISLTSGKDIKVIEPILKNSLGHEPMAGLDIEPNSVDDFIQDIIIERPYTENNAEYGIVIALTKLIGSPNPVSLKIIGHKDKGSKIGIGIIKCNGQVEGKVSIIEPVSSYNGDKGIFIRDHHSSGVEVEIVKPVIKYPFNIREEQHISNKYGGAISILRDEGDSTYGHLGNIKIMEAAIYDPLDKAFSDISIYDELLQVEDISIVNPTYLEHRIIRTNTHDLIKIKDDNRLLTMHINKEVSNILPINTRYVFVDNKGVSEYGGGSRTININRPLPNGIEVQVEVVEPHQIIVNLNSDVEVKPFQSSYSPFKSNQIGSRIKLKKMSDTLWIVTEIIGNWEGLNS